MAQKALCSGSSWQHSPCSRRDWPETHGKALHLRNVISWPLVIGGIVGESEEVARRSLSTHEPDNPEERETALSLKMWLPLAVKPAAEQKENETQDFPPGPPGEGVVLSPSPLEKEQIPTSPGCPCQSRFIVFCEDLAAP